MRVLYVLYDIPYNRGFHPFSFFFLHTLSHTRTSSRLSYKTYTTSPRREGRSVQNSPNRMPRPRPRRSYARPRTRGDRGDPDDHRSDRHHPIALDSTVLILADVLRVDGHKCG